MGFKITEAQMILEIIKAEMAPYVQPTLSPLVICSHFSTRWMLTSSLTIERSEMVRSAAGAL